MKTRKSWREKMDNPKLPEVVDVPPRMQKRFGTGAMLIPSPHDVDGFIRTVRKAGITPYWRVLKDDGSLNPKFPGGVDQQAKKLRAEGHRILPGSGKRPPRVAL